MRALVLCFTKLCPFNMSEARLRINDVEERMSQGNRSGTGQQHANRLVCLLLQCHSVANLNVYSQKPERARASAIGTCSAKCSTGHVWKRQP